MKSLLYLEIRQLINAIKNTTRSPKRLIPALLMGAWVGSWFIHGILQYTNAPGPRAPSLSLIKDIPISLLENGVFLFISIGSMIVMYNAFSSGMMIFSVSHIDFLFPTPIKRKSVLLMKLVKDYLKYGFYVAFFFMFMGIPAFGALNVNVVPSGFISIAAVTALMALVINLSHTINIIFTFGFERLKQAGTIIKVIIFGAPASAVAYGLYDFMRVGNAQESFIQAMNSPIINFVFAPAHWCAVLFLAPLNGVTKIDQLHLALLTAMALISFIVLLYRRENIYEPALGVSTKFAERRVAMRTGDYSGIRVNELRDKGATHAGGLSIPPFGRGAVAILWKSLLLRYRLSTTQLMMMIMLPIVLIYVIKVSLPRPELLSYLPMVLLYVVWAMSMLASAEMRSELKQANILKSMPIRAWKVMLAQAVNSTLYLTAGVFVFSAVMWILVPETRDPDPNKGSLLLACMFGAPFLGFVNVSASIVSALLYPDTRDPAQSFLGGMVSFILASLALIPCIVIVLGMLFALRSSYSNIAISVSLVNLIVGALGVALAGVLFHRFDPTSD
ncbi:MAG: hypothetical protein NT018_00925 [Armatimonadetes bacterium]|nr:hypothetical protein [Armatimonadota bacterium]